MATIADLDITTEELQRRMAELTAEAEEKARRIREGEAAEMRHLLHDPDPDSATPAFPDLRKGTSKSRGGAR
ncbi:hypothetical protein DEJ49_33115 [Streptomyces venezuelae]|uniref:Uncharacterized protein n=1 Tax=Streptomyces venezuelae TaxID=54571 RepID=A0A5P2CS04_STRVZ|nr:hypothetical protein [Streptomyces venezuelae]QES45183.1 hypothetical protein DEJ49_33115 [Streptomyces venezuelae]